MGVAIFLSLPAADAAGDPSLRRSPEISSDDDGGENFPLFPAHNLLLLLLLPLRCGPMLEPRNRRCRRSSPSGLIEFVASKEQRQQFSTSARFSKCRVACNKKKRKVEVTPTTFQADYCCSRSRVGKAVHYTECK